MLDIMTLFQWLVFRKNVCKPRMAVGKASSKFIAFVYRSFHLLWFACLRLSCLNSNVFGNKPSDVTHGACFRDAMGDLHHFRLEFDCNKFRVFSELSRLNCLFWERETFILSRENSQKFRERTQSSVTEIDIFMRSVLNSERWWHHWCLLWRCLCRRIDYRVYLSRAIAVYDV